MLHFNRTVIRNGSQTENGFQWAQCAGIFVASLHRNRFNVNTYSLLVLFSSSSLRGDCHSVLKFFNFGTEWQSPLNKPENQGTFVIIGSVDPLIFYYHILSEEIKLWLNIYNFKLEFDLLFPSNHAMKTARWYRVSRRKKLTSSLLNQFWQIDFLSSRHKPIIETLLPSFHSWILWKLSSPNFKWTRW